MKDIKVGVVLINYKDYAKRYLKECRDSLRLQSYPSKNFQVYIIDNASSSETKEFLENIYPEAKIIPRHDGNYSAANNLGFKKAIEDGCDYLVTANMDTEMDKDWLKELVEALDNNEKAAVAQSKILLFDKEGKERKINTLGNIFHFLGFGTTSFYKKEDREISGYPEINGYASGCSFIVKKEAYIEIGGWNEEYFMYHDDMEFSLKIRLLGYKIVLAPKSVIYHKYEFSRSVKMLYFMERNRYLLLFTFYPCHLILLLLPALFILDLGMLFFSIVKGWFGTWLKSRAYFLNPFSLVKILKYRREIHKNKKVSFKEISRYMSGSLDFIEIDNYVLRNIANPILNFYWKVIKLIS